jgi:hypothetical protein
MLVISNHPATTHGGGHFVHVRCPGAVMREMRLECARAASNHTTASGVRLLPGGHFTSLRDLNWPPGA